MSAPDYTRRIQKLSCIQRGVHRCPYNALGPARIVIPPRITAVDGGATGPPGQRVGHIRAIINDGRLKWQAFTGYGRRALIETAIGRYKRLIGRRLRARSFPAQQTEVAIACAVLNRMMTCACPDSVRCPTQPA